MTKTFFSCALGLLFSLGCSTSSSPGGVALVVSHPGDGQNFCVFGSRIDFEPPLAGTEVAYEITVDTDFGDTPRKFEAPFTCAGVAGLGDVQTNACLGDTHAAYGDLGVGVFPPMIEFKTVRGADSIERTESITSVSWGNFLSTAATVTVTREVVTVFDGPVTFAEATCTDGAGDTKYQLATVKVDLASEK